MLIIISNKKRLVIYISIFMLCIVSSVAVKGINKKSLAVSSNKKAAYIAIIIDDFGNNSNGTNEMISLPIKFTGAVMPSMPYSTAEAELLHQKGKDVILHQPMEAHHGKLSWLGKAPILNSTSPEQAVKILNYNLSQIPYCQGVNNHMGSKVSENKEIISALFSELKNKNLFYVDSLTTGKSITQKSAEEMKINIIKRDVFLDSTQDLAKVKANMLKAGDVALEKGYAVAIGHVGAEGGLVTYNAIKQTYAELENKGITFVGISELNDIINMKK